MQPREKTALTPRNTAPEAVLATADQVKKGGEGGDKTKQKEDSNTQKVVNEKKSRGTPDKEVGGEGGNGGGNGGPGLPDQEEPENPDLKAGPPDKSGQYKGLTMTGAGNLTETSEDQPELTAGDIEEMK